MRVLLCDVGPRDGLQNEPELLSPETRADLVDRLGAAGLRRIEAVSFVRADRVPQMAGAEEVIECVQRREGVELSGLVLNERGWERFAAAGLDRVNVTFAATETFNLRNGNATLAEATERAEAILAAAGETPATVTISCSFGCPFSPRATGNVATEDLVYLLEGEGVETGIDLDKLVDVSQWLEEVLGRTLEGYVYRAGSWPS